MTDRCEKFRRFQAIDEAYKRGDLAALRAAFGDSPDFPNGPHPPDCQIDALPLIYAIYWSPLALLRALLDLGADPDPAVDDGFPSLMATLTTDRPDKLELLELLIERGADPNQRGVNNWTALHHAVSLRDLAGAELLLRHGADPTLRTVIDDDTTPLEDAEALGFRELVELLRRGA